MKFAAEYPCCNLSLHPCKRLIVLALTRLHVKWTIAARATMMPVNFAVSLQLLLTGYCLPSTWDNSKPGCYSERKELAPRRSKFFPFESTPPLRKESGVSIPCLNISNKYDNHSRNIHYENTPIQFWPPLTPLLYRKLGFTGVYIIFFISAQNKDCGY